MKLNKLSTPKILIVLIYFSITYIWNLVPTDLIDISFVIMVCLFVFRLFKTPLPLYRSNKEETIAICTLIFFGIIQGIRTSFLVDQSFFNTFLTIREILYIGVAFTFAYCCEVTDKCFKTLLKLELIGCFLYFLTFLNGAPLSAFSHFKGSYVPVGSLTFYRDFTPNPVFTLFICPYLTIGVIKRNYIWNKQKDLLCLSVIISSLLLHFSRMRLILVTFEICALVILTNDKSRNKNVVQRVFKALISVSIITAIVFIIPPVRKRFIDGWSDVRYAISGNELNAYNGNFTYRLWLLSLRIKYLIRHRKIFWGMGAIGSRDATPYFGSGLPLDLAIIYNPDNAYITLLPRYGILGVGFLIGILIFIAVKCFKRGTKLSVSTCMLIICSIVGGMNGTAALCEYGLMMIGMFVGLSMAENKFKR